MKNNIKLIYISVLWVMLGLSSCASLTGNSHLTEKEIATKKANVLVTKATVILEEMTLMPDKGIPTALLQASEAIVIIPNMLKVGFGVGANLGQGLAVIRQADRQWSYPVLIKMGGGSLGLQIGAQASDIILVFKNRKGINSMVNGNFTLGADVGIAAGPVGVTTEAGTDIKFESEIYSYSRSKGLFAGVSLKGQVLEVDNPGNLNLYGDVVSADDIFAGHLTTSSSAVENLRNKLKEIAP